jgi:hypothetical protein
MFRGPSEPRQAELGRHMKKDWKNQVHEHFQEQRIGRSQATSLEKMLLARPVSVPPEWYGEPEKNPPSPNADQGLPKGNSPTSGPWKEPAPLRGLAVRSTLSKLHGKGIGYVLAALLSAGTTLAIVQNFQDDEDAGDPIAELANLAGPRLYPPDFDLEGDPAGFREVVQDLLPQHDFFQAELPKELGHDYLPSEGRFFTWSGEPGVSIQLKISREDLEPRAILYIVRLTERNERKFPKDTAVKRVTVRSGKPKKVNVWREGPYGYAMVQSVAQSD